MRNLYQRFTALTGRPLRTVATCISADPDECTVQYPGGALVRVKGAGVVDRRYFILDGRLDGEAPNLPAMEIEV